VITNIAQAVRYRNNKALPATIGIQAVITKENYTQLAAIADMAQSMGADYFQYRPVERGNVIDKPSLSGFKIRVIDSWYKWEEIKDFKGYTSCPGADFIGAVGADYNFYMCCHHVGDSTASYGNMLSGPILTNRKSIQDSFDYSKCPVACRGSVINRRLKSYNNIEHVNFL
jgi:MoaA/NifB/PqqE/SkfB family radical SAM enzyme